jgi:hypothetical protein
MVTKNKEIKSKICTVCGRRFPLTAKYWRRSSFTSDGFYPQCKACVSKSARDHYRKFTRIDVVERGQFGVKCVLWAPKCEVCPVTTEHDMSPCWRISGITLSSLEYPIPMEPETILSDSEG